ncbi:TPA: glycosyltransferase family 1 protein, partial [Mannheimia haemolytica]|nr:glycosyltransferase family 1 protein [Mannheimia haemolytica]
MHFYIISDDLTYKSISLEGINSKFSWLTLNNKSDSILFVESTWQGYKNRWKYKIASYPDHPKRTNQKLLRLVEKAKDKGIPTVFWNKEDSIHFDRFIDSAKHFDHIFTVDQNAIARYREVVPDTTTVNVGMFPVQPRIHNFQGFNFKHLAANFVGSYSHHIHNKRRERQDMLFGAALKAGLPVTIFDRNSDRKSENYRYPKNSFNLNVQPAVSYTETANIYRDYLVSLNINTVEDSPTMFSRRVVEILACGGILVSTPSMAIDNIFKEYCHIVQSEDEAIELFQRLKRGASRDDLNKAIAGSEFVLSNFTWE